MHGVRMYARDATKHNQCRDFKDLYSLRIGRETQQRETAGYRQKRMIRRDADRRFAGAYAEHPLVWNRWIHLPGPSSMDITSLTGLEK